MTFSKCELQDKYSKFYFKITKGMNVYRGILLEDEKNKIQTKKIGGIDFVLIKGNSFMMGSEEGVGESDEHPKHKVTIDSYWIGMYEVTQKQYQDIMGKNPSYYKGEILPVEQVTWDNAMEFCKKFGEKYKVKMRLPTEAEWEFACRADTTTNYYWGDKIDGDYCWYGQNSSDRNHPVGEKKPNPWGLYDMAGNVWEWCMDWYNEKYYLISPEKNPQGPNLSYYRVLRGGGRSREFGHRSTGRSSNDPSDTSDTNGFRVVIIP
jgi:formylglycine-generating enzyme required for sulfatase activity